MKPLDPHYLEILRKMSGQEKLRCAARMWWSARKFKAAYFRQQHPDWSEEKVEEEVKKWLLYARD